MDLVRSADADERADVVYARDLDEHANVESFLLALAELRTRTGPRRHRRRARASDGRTDRPDLRIDDRVEFLGELSANEAVPIMKGAHVFAQTATVEPFATTSCGRSPAAVSASWSTRPSRLLTNSSSSATGRSE